MIGVLIPLLISCCWSAELTKVQYQILSSTYKLGAIPTNYSTLTNENLKILPIGTAPDAKLSNPDYAIMGVSMKTAWGANASSTNGASYAQIKVLNSNLKEVTNLETANVTQSMDYACPTSNMSTVNTASTSFTFLGILSGTFNTDVDLSVKLDYTMLSVGNWRTATLSSSQRYVLYMLDVNQDLVGYRRSLHIEATSPVNDGINATMYIAPYCPAAMHDHFNGYERAKMTFGTYAQFSLHHSSFPEMKPQRYYIRIALNEDYNGTHTKEVRVSVHQGYDYTVFVPLSLYCLVCLFFATMITWGFFRVFSYCCDLPCYASWRRTMMGWFVRGEKGYAYWTTVVGMLVVLGEVITVGKAYNQQITQGDRDICFYNEKCYRPVDLMDMPTNAVTSNLAFLLHGIMITIVISLMESKCGENNHIHEHSFSLAYSLGIAHILQALCSGLYAVCPSRLSASYDLTFLYITIGLYVACLFDRGSINYVKDQKMSRFCSIPAKPVRASKFYIFLIGPMLVLQYTEMALTTCDWPNSYKYAFWAVFFAWLGMVHAWIAFKAELFPMDFYRWLTDGRCDPDHPEFCNWWDCYSYKMKRDSGYGWKMLLFIVHTLISVTFAGYEGFFCDHCDFSYFFMGWLLLGLIFSLLFSLFDQIALENKFAHSSWHTNFTWVRVIYSVLVLGAWAAAVYVYRKYDLSSARKTPQESRDMNKECIFFDYYDGNDMFSLLTSFAMLSTTYLVIYLNYPCVECVSAHYGLEYTGRRFSMSMTDNKNDGGGAKSGTHDEMAHSGGKKSGCGNGGCNGGSSCGGGATCGAKKGGCGMKGGGGGGHGGGGHGGGGHGGNGGGPMDCGCSGENCGCAKKSCGCSIKSLCDCKQREASRRSSCKGGCPHTNEGFKKSTGDFRHASTKSKDSMMTDATGMSDDISYINISDDVPDPQIIFKAPGKNSKYPSVVLAGEDDEMPGGKTKEGYFY